MNKDSFLSLIYKKDNTPLYVLLDELLNISSKPEHQNIYEQLLNDYSIPNTKRVESYFEEINEDVFYYKFMYLQKSYKLYLTLYEAIKNNGFSIKDTLKVYSDSGRYSLPVLYENVLRVYDALDENQKNQFKNEIVTYCNVVSGRFQPFISDSIDETDESNIICLQRTLDIIQETLRRAFYKRKIRGNFSELLDSDHFLLDVRKILEKEIPQDASKKYSEYLKRIIIDRELSFYGASIKANDNLKYDMDQLEVVIKFIEIAFKNYKNIENPQDISFNQMIELMYYSCKSTFLKEVSQEDIDRLMSILYDIVTKLEKDYKEKYGVDIYKDLASSNLKDPNENAKYLMRVLQLGYSEALYNYIAAKYYGNNPDIYKLHLISKKGNQHLDLDLYNELVFAKNLRYLLETNDTTIIKWLKRKCLKWDKVSTKELKDNLTSLYGDENKINSSYFATMQSDFVVPDELILKLPRLYSIEDIKINNKDNIIRMGVLLKNQNATMIRNDKENANYYLLHIDINDINQDKSKFEMQLNLLVGSEISNRIQILRMDNYVNKGIHKNTGSLRIDTTTHLHKYNALNKVRKNKNGEMDIYKNWENGVENFTEGLEIFLKEMGMNVELQKILKKQILNNINSHKNNRV